MAFIDYLKDESEMRERFIGYAYDRNPNIKDFRQFSNALRSSFNSKAGQGVLKDLNDHETKFLFESEENKRMIKRNLSDKEFKEIYEDLEDYEVQRAVGKGELTKPSDIKVIHAPRKISVGAYSKDGVKIKSHNRGYSKWNNSELNFLRIRKERKLARKDIINQYNQHFKMKRSESSLTSRIYRL